jgi:hypothetical protein
MCFLRLRSYLVWEKKIRMLVRRCAHRSPTLIYYSIYLYTYIYIYIAYSYILVYIHTYIYIYIYIYTYIYIYMFIYMFIYIYTYIYCLFKSMYSEWPQIGTDRNRRWQASLRPLLRPLSAHVCRVSLNRHVCRVSLKPKTKASLRPL